MCYWHPVTDFHLLMSKLIGSTKYETYVIGDLDKLDARLFWQKKLKELLGGRNIHILEFENVYNICGGNTFLLGCALNFCLAEDFWNKFPYITQEISKLVKACFPYNLPLYEEGKSMPAWSALSS